MDPEDTTSFFIRIHSHQYGVLKFGIENNELELNFLTQYFPGSTGLSYINELGVKMSIFATKNDSNTDSIFVNNQVLDYVISYGEGKEVTAEELATEYFYKQYSYAKICQILSDKHGIQISLPNLQSYFAKQGLKRKDIIETDVEQVAAAIFLEVRSAGMNLGYRSMWRRLRDSFRFDVKQSTVRQLLKIIDPEDVKIRTRKRLRRRNYSVPGPNHIWHVDSYDKIEPYGFAVHACVDGFSRRVLWMTVGTTNNKPEVIAHNFTSLVLETGFGPRVLRVDAGTENTMAGSIQQALRHYHNDPYAGQDSFVVGPSTANQRIERYWGEARANTMGFYIDLFKTLIDRNLLNNKDILDRELLRFCFAPLIQRQLNRAKEEWNSHRVRNQRSRGLPSGIPNIMYYCPRKSGAVDCKQQVNKEDVERIMERFTILPEFYNSKIKDLVRLLLPQATTTETAEEAYNLFSDVKRRMIEQITGDQISAITQCL